MKPKLSVVLATRNESSNLASCLESVKGIADEIIVLDEYSDDDTREIAKKYGAAVYLNKHNTNFHVTKQKAIDLANGEWILQLDADEEVSSKLCNEIKKVISLPYNEVDTRRPLDKREWRLFMRHQEAIERRDGLIGRKEGEYVAYFIPRKNYFVGKPLMYGGVYPDGVIRLIKKGSAYLPQKSVHEQMKVDGKIGWLYAPLIHNDSPTLYRYLERLNRYTELNSNEMQGRNTSKSITSFFYYSIYLFAKSFIRGFVVNKGYKDGVRGFLWAWFSAWHFPISYFKYCTLK